MLCDGWTSADKLCCDGQYNHRPMRRKHALHVATAGSGEPVQPRRERAKAVGLMVVLMTVVGVELISLTGVGLVKKVLGSCVEMALMLEGKIKLLGGGKFLANDMNDR